jgi:hypothetical protein
MGYASPHRFSSLLVGAYQDLAVLKLTFLHPLLRWHGRSKSKSVDKDTDKIQYAAFKFL